MKFLNGTPFFHEKSFNNLYKVIAISQGYCYKLIID